MNLGFHLTAASTKVLWPEALIVLTGAAHLPGTVAPHPVFNIKWGTRLLAFLGLCSTAALLFLGILSPYYGIVALLAIPAPILFGVVVVRPAAARDRPKVRLYLTGYVVASVLTWAFQIFWELRA